MESGGSRASIAFMNYGIKLRPTADTFEASSQRTKKVLSESNSAIFIPAV